MLAVLAGCDGGGRLGHALPLGALLSLLLVVWYYWRLLRGFVRALDDKPY